MKKEIYSLADEEFVTLLDRTHRAFEKNAVPYMLVGGVAIQAHIIQYLCKTGKTLLDLIKDPNFRMQDHLRATDDIDITLKGNGEDEIAFANRLYNVLDDIVGKKEGEEEGVFFSPTRNHLISIALSRKGLSRPIFRLGVDKEPDPESIVSFNLYKGAKDTNERWGQEIRDFESKFYYVFMDRAMEVEVPYCSGQEEKINLRVKKPEDLIATKLIRGRPKDINDILSLANHSEEAEMPIDYDAVRDILCSNDPRYNKPNLAFVEKYEWFIDMLKKTKRG